MVDNTSVHKYYDSHTQLLNVCNEYCAFEVNFTLVLAEYRNIFMDTKTR